MYGFHWVPAGGKRHASKDPRPEGGYPTGCNVDTLCDQQVTANSSKVAWFWPTCPDCNGIARQIVGAAP